MFPCPLPPWLHLRAERAVSRWGGDDRNVSAAVNVVSHVWEMWLVACVTRWKTATEDKYNNIILNGRKADDDLIFIYVCFVIFFFYTSKKMFKLNVYVRWWNVLIILVIENQAVASVYEHSIMYVATSVGKRFRIDQKRIRRRCQRANKILIKKIKKKKTTYCWPCSIDTPR